MMEQEYRLEELFVDVMVGESTLDVEMGKEESSAFLRKREL